MSIILEYIKEGMSQQLLNRLKTLGETDLYYKTLYIILKEEIERVEPCYAITKLINTNVIEKAMLYVLNYMRTNNKEVDTLYTILSSMPNFSFGHMFLQDYETWSDNAKRIFHEDLVSYLDERGYEDSDDHIYHALCDIFLRKDRIYRIADIAKDIVNKKLKYIVKFGRGGNDDE
jgi:hypothetical protein